MPRAKNDAYKRKSAQALNHLAAAILDINDIYVQFEAQFNMLVDQAAAAEKTMDDLIASGAATEVDKATDPVYAMAKANLERYAGYRHDLYTVMMGIAAVREHIILFIGEVWNLDEESVKVYIS